MTISNIDWWIKRTLPEVYSDDLSYYELLERIMAKLNEVVDSTNTFITTDLSSFVSDRLTTWKGDGTLNQIINQSVFTDLDTFRTNNKKVVINPLDYGFIGDGSFDNLQKFKDMITANPNGGKVHFPVGTFYISNEGQLNSLIQNFEFVGVYGKTILSFGQTLGTGTNSIPSAVDVPNWKYCTFRGITFTAPNSSNFAVFTSGSDHLYFYNCIIKDVKSHFLQCTGDVAVFKDCKFIAPDTPAGTCLMAIGNVRSHFVVDGCEWNYAPNQGGGCLISATNQAGLIGDYWFINNKVFTDQLTGYLLDTFVDLEPNDANVSIRNVHIKNNTVYNSKIWVGGATDVQVEGNIIHFTPVYGNGSANSPITINSSYATAPIKRIDIKNNTVICEEMAGWGYKQPIGVVAKSNIDSLVIKGNNLIANGLFNGGSANIINIDVSQNTINRLVINDNEMKYTSKPSTPAPAIEIMTNGANTVNSVEIRRNKVRGVMNTISALVHESSAGANSTIDEFIVMDNNVREVCLTANIIAGSPNPITYLNTNNNIGAN